MKVKEIIIADANAESGFSGTGDYKFICPGCGHEHIVNTKKPLHNGAIWGFNGNLDKPGFTPSVNIKTGHYVDGQPPADQCVCAEDEDYKGMCFICPFVITDGIINFCGDCTHELSGKSVEMQDIKEAA